jgi:uncharacterized membrane protein
MKHAGFKGMDDRHHPLADQVLEEMDHRRVSPTDQIPAVLALTILGVGLLALFLGYSWFWMVFAFGFAVVLPLVTILTQSFSKRRQHRRERRRERHRERDEWKRDERTDRSKGYDGKQDALDTLRDRYARGKIDEDEFERRVDLLLENETIGDVKARRERKFN